jgi:hypothetical protein
MLDATTTSNSINVNARREAFEKEPVVISVFFSIYLW